MTQTLLSGLVGAAGIVIVGLLTFIGVMWKTERDFRLGKIVAGVQAQSEERLAREELKKEIAELRDQVAKLWTSNEKLRDDLTAAGELSDTERAGWRREKRALLEAAEDRDAENARLVKKLATSAEDLENAGIMCSAALAAQQRAEGALSSARQTIQDLCPVGS